MKGSSHIVSFADIFDLVGNEKSTQGDTNCLSDLVSTRWHQFGWGAKKGFCTLRRCFQFRMFFVGEDVIVLNHDTHWKYQAKIVHIDTENDTAMIRWEQQERLNQSILRIFKNSMVQAWVGHHFVTPLKRR